MAKLGEGDPRWLVQERSDGTNVNNWHWSEKDCTEWCKQRLGELFRDLPLLTGSGPGSLSAHTTGVESLGGEAFINIRKAKMIPSYELDIKIGWSGEARDGDGNSVSSSASRGKLHLPYVADENHDEEPELKVLCDVQDAVTNRLKDAILKEAKKTIIKTVHQFVSELRAGGPAASERPGASSSSGAQASAAAAAGSGAAAPAKPKLSSAAPEEVEQQNKAAAGASASGSSAAAGAAKKSDKTKTKGRSLKITEKYYARPKDIYECFTLEGKLRAFTQSPATVDVRPEGAFSWFSGSVTGIFRELVPNKRIAMDWRFSSWEDGCFSQVTIDIEEPEEGNTVVKLAQSGIPEADRFGNEDVLDVTEKGWRGQVLMRIRQVFGYGV